jgi:hypothetical protein
MKMRAFFWFIPALAVALSACKKKEPVTPEPPVAEEGAHAQAPGDGSGPGDAPAPPSAGLSAEERAARLGFARHLPQDIEALAAFHNGGKIAEKFQASQVWKVISAGMGGGMGMGGGFDPGFEPDIDIEMDDEDDLMPEEEQDEEITEDDSLEADEPAMAAPLSPGELLGMEVTIAMGASTGDQLGHLLTLNRRSSYYQMRALAKFVTRAVEDGGMQPGTGAFQNSLGVDMIPQLLNDEESGVALLEKLGMPPLYIAMRVEPAQLAAAAQQISEPLQMLASLGEMVEPVEIERNGSKFSGYRIIGTEVAKLMAAQREDMDETLGAETVDRLIKVVETKDIVVLSGTLGDYVVLFAGASAEDFKPAASVTDSYVATDALAFTDACVGKELVAVMSGRKEMLATMMANAGGIADMAKGIRDGMAGGAGLGETRDLEALLDIVVEREAALRKFTMIDGYGTVAFMEDGLKIESFGGISSGMLDLKTPARLAGLGDSEDVVLFINATSDAAYDEKARAYFESLLETAYAMTMKVAELPDDRGNEEFKQMAQLFDTQYRTDIVSLWDALGNDFSSGLGTEGAMIIDMKGTMPAVPGVPKAILDNGRIPRIAVVSTVNDRAKIASAWDKTNSALTNLLAKASEMTGTEIPMQKPISSEKNGFTTWFISMPFFNDEFLPSVTVGDEWFAVTTSKTHALELLDQASKAEEGAGGMVFRMNFKPLQNYARQTLELVENNSAEIFGDDASQLESFNSSKKDILKLIEAMDDLDSLSVRAFLEGSVRRSSVHFKTR